MSKRPAFTYKEPPCNDGGKHDWDLGAMGPGVALMYCMKCRVTVHMKAGHKDRYVRADEEEK